MSAEKACEEDYCYCQRTDVTDEEPEDSEEPGIAAEGASVGEFIIYFRLLESPSHKEDCEEATERHEYVRRQVVKEVEQVAASYLYV